MKKRLFVGAGIVIFSVAVTIGSNYFAPRPLVADPNTASIIQIIYISDLGDSVVEVQHYDEEKLLQYLHQCLERKTLFRVAKNGYALCDFDFIITLHDRNTIKQIRLGPKSSDTNCGYGTLKYEIIEPNPMVKEIKKILAIPAEAEPYPAI